jgi:hypothetical protein
MTGSRKILILGGMMLAAVGMLYGLYYAVFVEHQTLDQMGGSLARAFSSAAERDSPAFQTALQAYASAKYDYVRQVDAHSHWIGLGMLLILLGAVFGRLNFSEAFRRAIAISLLTGSVVFPLSVILQTYHHDAFVLKALAIAGPGLVIFGLTATAWGFARQRTLTEEPR